MPQFYLVKGIGGGFDGLVVEAFATQESSLVEVHRLIDRGSIVGDRNTALPVPGESIYINKKFLEEVEDPGVREFASDNPFGQLRFEGHMECGDVKVAYAQYDNAMSVTLMDVATGRTLVAMNFKRDFDKVKQTIESVLKGNGGDADDLVFQLLALKEGEKNG